MFSQPARYMPLDNKWGDSFTLIDPVTTAVLDLTGMSATIQFRPENYSCGSSDWYNSASYGTITASTDNGQIVNGGANGTLTVNVTTLRPGVYKVRGETSAAGITTPFLSGRLSLSRDGVAQMAVNPIGTSALLWNNGGVLTFVGDVSNLPTSLPAAPGIAWNNGGVVSIS